MLSHIGVLFMRLLGYLPLRGVRWLGWLLGCLLCLLVVSRRRVAQKNLSLCFPAYTQRQINRLTLQTFICFAQAWLDRGWLWHGAPETVKRRLVLSGALNELSGAEPVVLFAPHFVGLDAGWTALTQQVSRRFTTIYTNQANKVVDSWVLAGRQRYGFGRLFGRVDGVKTIVAELRAGAPLYLLPDMNYGPEESVFVPFYGVLAATVPSLSRFAKLGRAKVVPVITRMTSQGYEIQIMPSWKGFPSDDVVADTLAMNQALEKFINTMPDQYYWVHKRFKDRPPGVAAIY